MSGQSLCTLSLSITIGLCASIARCDPPRACPGTEPSARERFFEEEVWAKVGERTCLRCHHQQGDAAESGFVLQSSDAEQSEREERIEANYQAFRQVALRDEGNLPLLLQKVTGGLEHGGGVAVPKDSRAYRILECFLLRTRQTDPQATPISSSLSADSKPFDTGVTKLSLNRLLRRTSLSLVGRLPTQNELNTVAQEGDAAIEKLTDAMMREDAFYERLKEAFNDIFLTRGIEDNAESLLSYHHFEKTRHWYNTFDLSDTPEKDRQKARWKLADVYREALLREPLELIAHVVRNDRPVSEILTADYILVSPYTSRGYGVFEEIREDFKDTNDPFEYVPVRLKSLQGRDKKTQESATGYYPHAGLLSMFHYLRRYPTTDTNRNRLRARMLYQHFLGVDIMQLAPRSSDAAAVAAKFQIPTMQAGECVVCHKTIDPVAGLFQDYNAEGHLGPRPEGWYQDMFEAGFEGESIPKDQRWRALQWVSERIVKDPRFAIAMAEHAFYILVGRRPLSVPEDIDDPLFTARRHAYLAQRQVIHEAARRLQASDLNFKTALQAIIQSSFYQADGLTDALAAPERAAELEEWGVVRLLAPEQLERKIEAIFGARWGKLHDEYAILYGGIDSQTVTERNSDPSGAMGAIQRMMANDVACYHVARDFRKPPEERTLFRLIEPDVLPGTSTNDQQIRDCLIDLYQRVLGLECKADDPEIQLAFELFKGVINDAQAQGKYEQRESYFCGGREEFHTADPHYTIRAWRTVVTYMLRQHAFLYE